jgi:hypothetical protein
MASGMLLEAPADRPAGQRGWRGAAAFVVAVAAIAPLAFSRIAIGWDRAGYLAVAAVLATAAVLTWTTRRTPVLVLAGVAVGASALAVVLMGGAPNVVRAQGSAGRAEMEYTYDRDGRAISPAEAKAVREGSTEDEVEEMLGSAAGSGTLRRRDGTDSHCLIYPYQADRQPHEVFALCFSEDRYASLHRW